MFGTRLLQALHAANVVQTSINVRSELKVFLVMVCAQLAEAALIGGMGGSGNGGDVGDKVSLLIKQVEYLKTSLEQVTSR